MTTALRPCDPRTCPVCAALLVDLFYGEGAKPPEPVKVPAPTFNTEKRPLGFDLTCVVR
jgi:hypothetical protein